MPDINKFDYMPDGFQGGVGDLGTPHDTIDGVPEQDPVLKAFGQASDTIQNQNPIWNQQDILNKPYKTKLDDTLRYTDPDIGFNPFDSRLEYKYADAHPIKTLGNNILQGGAKFLGTALETIATIPLVLSGQNLYNNDFTNGINDWLESLNTSLPVYTNEYEANHPILKYLTFWKPTAFFGAYGNAINNLGFTAGAIAGSYLTMMPFNWLGDAFKLTRMFGSFGRAVATDAAAVGNESRALVVASDRGLAVTGQGVLENTPELATQAGPNQLYSDYKLATGEGLPNQTLPNVTKNIAAKSVNTLDKSLTTLNNIAKVRDWTKYNLSLLVAATAEASFEANNVMSQGRKNLEQKFYEQYGRSPVGKELDAVASSVKEVADFTMAANVALLYLNNRIVWGSMFKPGKMAEQEVVDGYLKNVSKKVLERDAQTGVYNVINRSPETRMGKLLLNLSRPGRLFSTGIGEGIEEGSQFIVSESSLDYANRKYDAEQRGEVASYMKSFVHGVNRTFASNDGWDNIMGGFVGGLFGHFLQHRIEKGKGIVNDPLARLQQQADLLNTTNLTGLFEHKIQEAAVNTGLAKDYKTAIEAGDKFTAKNLKHQMLFNYVSSAIKANRFDMRIDELEAAKQLSGEEFKKMWGEDYNDVTGKTAHEYLDTVIDKAKNIKRDIDKVNRLWQSNPFSAKTEPHDYLAYDSYKDQLALNLTTSKEYQSRMKQVESDLKALLPNIDVQRALEVTSLQGMRDMLNRLQKTMTELAKQESELKGTPELTKDLIEKRKKLKELFDELQPQILEGFNAKTFTKTIEKLYKYYSGLDDTNNEYIDDRKQIGEANTLYLQASNNTRKSTDELADALQQLQDIRQLAGANFGTLRYYDYLQTDVGQREFIDKIKQKIQENLDKLVTDETGRTLTPEEVANKTEEDIRFTVGEPEDVEETTSQERDTIRKAAKKKIAGEQLTPEEETVASEKPTAFTNEVKVQDLTQKEVKRKTGKATVEPKPAAETLGNIQFRGIEPRNVFGLFSADKNDIKFRTNLYTAIFKSGLNGVLRAITATYNEATPNQTDFRKIPGTQLFRSPFKENVTIYHSGQAVGILRPADSVWLDSDGTRSVYDMTADEYEAYTGNNPNTYDSFMAAIKGYQKAYNALRDSTKAEDGKAVDIIEIQKYFNLLINPGSRVQNNDYRKDTVLRDLNYKPAGTALISFVDTITVNEHGKQSSQKTTEPAIVNESELTDKQLIDLHFFIQANLKHFRSNFNRYIVALPINGQYNLLGLVAARNAETTQAQRDNFYKTVKDVAAGAYKDAEDAGKISQLVNEDYFLANADRTVKQSFTSIAFTTGGDMLLNINNPSQKVYKQILIKQADLQQAKDFNSLITKMQAAVYAEERKDKGLAKLNIIFDENALKQQVPHDTKITSLTQVEDKIKLATTADVFENYTIHFDPKSQVATTTEPKQPEPPQTSVTPEPKVAEVKSRVRPYSDPDDLKGTQPDTIMHFNQGVDKNRITLIVDPEVKDEYSTSSRKYKNMSKDNSSAGFKHILKDIAKNYRDEQGKDVIVDLRGIDLNQSAEAIIAQIEPKPATETLGNVQKPTFAKNKEGVKQIMQDLFKLSEDQATAVAEIYDLNATAWSQRTGKPKEDFYKQLGFKNTLEGENLENIINQDNIYDEEHTDKRKVGKFTIDDNFKIGSRIRFIIKDGKKIIGEGEGISLQSQAHQFNHVLFIHTNGRNIHIPVKYIKEVTPIIKRDLPTGANLEKWFIQNFIDNNLFEHQVTYKSLGEAIKSDIFVWRRVLGKYNITKQDAEKLREILKDHFKDLLNKYDDLGKKGTSQLSQGNLVEDDNFKYTQNYLNKIDKRDRNTYEKYYIGLQSIEDIYSYIFDINYDSIKDRKEFIVAVEKSKSEPKPSVETNIKVPEKYEDFEPWFIDNFIIHMDSNYGNYTTAIKYTVFTPEQIKRGRIILEEAYRELFNKYPNIFDAYNNYKDVHDIPEFEEYLKDTTVKKFHDYFIAKQYLDERETLNNSKKHGKVDYKSIEEDQDNFSISKSVSLDSKYGIDSALLSIEALENDVANVKEIVSKKQFDDYVYDSKFFKALAEYTSKDPVILNQNNKGAYNTLTNTIYVLTNPDVSTPLHELAHSWEQHLTTEERNKVQDWAKTGDTWTRETSEKFASGFEKYLAEGKAPSNLLQELFDKFAKWLQQVYTDIKAAFGDITLNDDMRSIYAKMLGQNVETKTEKPLEKELLTQLREKAGEAEKGADLQYFIDKAGENADYFTKKYGEDITSQLLAQVTTAKLEENVQDMYRFGGSENPSIDILNRELDRRDAEQPKVESKPAEQPKVEEVTKPGEDVYAQEPLQAQEQYVQYTEVGQTKYAKVISNEGLISELEYNGKKFDKLTEVLKPATEQDYTKSLPEDIGVPQAKYGIDDKVLYGQDQKEYQITGAHVVPRTKQNRAGEEVTVGSDVVYSTKEGVDIIESGITSKARITPVEKVQQIKKEHLHRQRVLNRIANHFQRLFPQIKYEVGYFDFAAPARFYKGIAQINVGYENKLSEQSRKNRQVQAGDVFLKRETVAHEFMHPFILALKQSNPQLFNNLVKELQKTQPEIVDHVNKAVTAGVYEEATKNDEALAIYLGQEITKAFDKNGVLKADYVKDSKTNLAKRFFDWLQDIWNFITGNKKAVTLDEFIKRANTDTTSRQDVLRKQIVAIDGLKELYAKKHNRDIKATLKAISKEFNKIGFEEFAAKYAVDTQTLDKLINDVEDYVEQKSTGKFQFETRNNENYGVEFDENGDTIKVFIDPSLVVDMSAASVLEQYGDRLKDNDLVDEYKNLVRRNFYKKGTGIENKNVSVKQINPFMRLQDVSDFIITQLSDSQYAIQYTGDELSSIDELEAYMDLTEPEAKQFREKIIKRLEALKDTSNRRLNNDTLQLQHNVINKLNLDSNDIDFVLGYVEQGTAAINLAWRKYNEIRQDLDNRDTLDKFKVNRLSKELEVVKQLLSFYEDVSGIYSNYEEMFEVDQLTNFRKATVAIDRIKQSMANTAAELATAWLYPYVEKNNEYLAKQGYTDPKYTVTRDDFKNNLLYGTNKDIGFITFQLGAMVTSRDPINAAFANTVADSIHLNHIDINNEIHDYVQAYNAWLKRSGIANFNEKTQIEFYEKNYLRKAKLWTVTGYDQVANEPIYGYVEKSALHQEYDFDKIDDAVRLYKKSLPIPRTSEEWDAQQQAVIKYRNDVKGNFVNAKYAALQSDPYFKAITALYKRQNEKYGKDALIYGIVPQLYRGNVLKKAQENFKAAWKEGDLKNNAKQVGRYVSDKLAALQQDNKAINLDGTVYRVMNKELANLKDDDKVEKNLQISMVDFIIDASRYSSLREIQWNAENLRMLIEGNTKFSVAPRKIGAEDIIAGVRDRRALSEAKEKLKELDKLKAKNDPLFNQKEYDDLKAKIAKGVTERSVWDKFLPRLKKGQTEHLNKQLSEMLNDVFYGEKEFSSNIKVLGQNISLNKVGANVGIYTSVASMAFNRVAGVANVLQGDTQIWIEALGGKYYTTKDVAWATGHYFKNSTKYMMDLTNPIHSKDTQLALKYDAIQGEYEDEYGVKVSGSVIRRMLKPGSLFFLTKLGEHQIQLTGMLSLMHATKVKTTSGETINLYDAYVADANGRYNLRSDVKFNEDDNLHFKRTLHGINRSLNGNYNELHKGHLQRTWYGKQLIRFRKWIYEGFRARWSGERVDYEKNVVEQGYLNYFLNDYLFNALKQRQFNLAKQYKNLTPDGKYRVNKASAEIALVTMLTLLAVSLTGDPDKKELTQAEKAILLFTLRLRGDYTIYHIEAPSEAARMFDNPSASVAVVKKVLDVLIQLKHPNETYDRDYGIYKEGDNKLEAKLKRIVPILNKADIDWDNYLKYYNLVQKTP